MSIHVDVGIDPARHDRESLQIVGRALSAGVNPRDTLPLNDDIYIAHHTAFAVDERRCAEDNRAVLRSHHCGRHKAGGNGNPQH